MKKLLLAFLLFTTAKLCCAQTSVITNRRVNFKLFNKDSLNLYMNDAYFLIEDSCASIIRYTHFNFDTKRFYGNFKDVNKTDPSIIINEGNYNNDGLKDGDFTLRYLNGNLRAKGKFRSNKFIGDWELYYENGSAKVKFNVDDGIITVTDAWDEHNVKTVSNGNGYFVVDNGNTDIVWHGKLANGRPDSTWNFSNLSDPHSKSFIEYFKKGKFVKGKNPMITYDDASHITLVDENSLSINNAEKLAIAPFGCNTVQTGGTANFVSHSIENAKYFNGIEVFTLKINETLWNVGKIRVDGANASLVVDGIIDEKGNIGNFVSNDKFDERVSHLIISDLENLPQLTPATYDKKPAKQKFRITFVFNNYSYKFTYQFLQVIPPDGANK